MNKILLTQKDNDLLVEHVNLFNENKEIAEQVVMDCYIDSIEYINDEIYLNIIGKDLPEGVKVRRDSLPVGEKTTMVLSKIRDKDIKSIAISFLRDLKILKLDI